MTIAPEFQQLWLAYGSPDEEQFKRVMRSSCIRCYGGMYEDEIYESLCHILTYLSGVRFIRAYEDGVRPQSIVGAIQYGTIFIQSYDINGATYRFNNVIAEDSQRQCSVIARKCTINVQLNVYREGGIANADQDNTSEVGVAYSSADVLNKIINRVRHTDVLRLIRKAGFVMSDFNPVTNAPIEVQGSYEQRATTISTIHTCVADNMQLLGNPPIGDLIFCEELRV